MKRSGHCLIRGSTGPCHSAGDCEALKWPPDVPLHIAAGLPFLILGTEPSSGGSSSALTDKSDGTEQPSQGPGSGQAAWGRWRFGAGSQPLCPWVPADRSCKARDQRLLNLEEHSAQPQRNVREAGILILLPQGRLA